MLYDLPPSFFGWVLIICIFAYTVYLVRSGLLSAHFAISWIIAELFFMAIMYFDCFRNQIRIYMGEERAAYSFILVGAIWFVYLMLETLTRISILTSKLKNVNQELALLREKVNSIEHKLKLPTE